MGKPAAVPPGTPVRRKNGRMAPPAHNVILHFAAIARKLFWGTSELLTVAAVSVNAAHTA